MDTQIGNVRIRQNVPLNSMTKIHKEFHNMGLKMPDYFEILKRISKDPELLNKLKGTEFPVEGSINDLRGLYRIGDVSLEKHPRTSAETVIVTGGQGQVILGVHARIASALYGAGFTLKSLEQEMRVRTLVGIVRE